MVRKAFLTPPEIPEGLTCRTLKMPNSKEWLGVFNSALLNTVQAWQWEQVNDTDLTVEEAVAKCQEILAVFWEASECDVCTQPGGMPFIGFDEFGYFKQLGEEGWVEPYGDYAVPAIPPRESGTDSEKRCLAAANCANCLKVLYEQLADDYAADRTTAEAISNLATAIALLIGAWLGLAIVAIIVIYRIMFQVVYETIEFVTADYWSSEFDGKLQCALYNCSAVDGEGVVTFNMDCLVQEIAETTSLLDNPAFVLLFGQVQTMLSFIGTDGINAAGATTAISSADCSECDDSWCYNFDFTAGEQGWTIWTTDGGTGTFSAGAFRSVVVSDNLRLSINLTGMGLITLTQVLVVFTTNGASGGGTRAVYSYDPLYTIGSLGGFSPATLDFLGETSNLILALDTAGNNSGENTITRVQLRGIGENPFGEDNCD